MSGDDDILASLPDKLRSAGIWDSLKSSGRKVRANNQANDPARESACSGATSSGNSAFLMMAEESKTAEISGLELDTPPPYRSIYSRLKDGHRRLSWTPLPSLATVSGEAASSDCCHGFFSWAPSILAKVLNLLTCMACCDTSAASSAPQDDHLNGHYPASRSGCAVDSISSSSSGQRQSHRVPVVKQEVEDSSCNGKRHAVSSTSSRSNERSVPAKQDECEKEDPARVVPDLRHLVLNMDINKTVLMTDSTNGKTPEQVVNETLANTSWGKEVDGEWILCVEEPSVLRPEPHLVSYVEWVESYHPGRENNDIRNKKNGTFSHPGRPGERMAPFARKLITSLRMPDGTEMRLIPSFFHLLLYLKEAGRSFCLCFRTFGLDLLDVAQELNMFCEGRHPLFPGVVMDGSDGQPDYRLHVEDAWRFGTFFRDRLSGEIALVMGTVEQPGEGQYRKEIASLDFYKRFPDATVIDGNEAVQKWLWDKSLMCGTLGIRDYFQYWKANGMTAQGGKPLFYAPYRSTKVHQIFFDDNIRYGDAYIVNAIDVREPQRCQWVTPLLETHLCRAEPLESIKDTKYFVKQLQRLEVGYERKLQARERLCRLLARVVRSSKSQKALKKYESIQKGYRENGTSDQVENSSKDVVEELPQLPQYDAWRDRRRPSRISSGEDCSVIEQLVTRRRSSQSQRTT